MFISFPHIIMRFEELYLQYKYISAILEVNAEMMKITLNIRPEISGRKNINIPLKGC